MFIYFRFKKRISSELDGYFRIVQLFCLWKLMLSWKFLRPITLVPAPMCLVFDWFWGFPEQNKDFAIQNMGSRGYHFVSIAHSISSSVSDISGIYQYLFSGRYSENRLNFSQFTGKNSQFALDGKIVKMHEIFFSPEPRSGPISTKYDTKHL